MITGTTRPSSATSRHVQLDVAPTDRAVTEEVRRIRATSSLGTSGSPGSDPRLGPRQQALAWSQGARHRGALPPPARKHGESPRREKPLLDAMD